MTDREDGERRVAIDADESELSLVRERLRAGGWTIVEGEEWELSWTLEPARQSVLSGLDAGRWLNHFPGIGALTRKDSLYRTVEAHRALLAQRGIDIPAIVPRTFVMPEDWSRFHGVAAREPSTRWIQKPKAAARGEGVSVLADPHECEVGSNWLVQEYLDRPHLIDGRKYSLRWYVLLTDTDPLSAFIFDDGFVKLASRPFEGAPAEDRFAHLTNPDVLSHDPLREVSSDNLTHRRFAVWLTEQGIDPVPLFRAIEEIIVVALAAARELISRACWVRGASGARSFELLGLDVVLDEDLRPWLVDVNMSPSLMVEASTAEASAEERDLKSRLVDGVLRSLNLVDSDADSGFRKVLPDPARVEWLTLPRPSEGAGPTPTARPVATTLLGDGLLVESRGTAEVHLFDPTAAYLWSALEDGLSPDAMVEELSDAVPGAAWRAHADVWNALSTWVEQGLADLGVGEASQPAEPAPPVWHSVRRWNPGGVYRYLGVPVQVNAPTVDAQGWIDSAIGALRSSDAERAVGQIDVVHASDRWWVVFAEQQIPCRSERQLGSACRLALTEIAGAATTALWLEATLLRSDLGTVLLTGPRASRAALMTAWTADGRECIADDLISIGHDGWVSGEVAGIEVGWSGDWYGELPSWRQGNPLLVSPFGKFISYRWATVGMDPVRPTCHVHLNGRPPAGILVPSRSNEFDAVADLLRARLKAARRIDGAMADDLVELARRAQNYRATAGEATRSLLVLDHLLEASR